MSSGLLLKLQALQYPAVASLTSDPSLLSPASASLSSASVRTLVAWLEASKIRLWPVAERAGLQDVQNDARWADSFDAYLRALNCTRAFGKQHMSSEQVLGVLDWLAAQAIAAEYADRAQEYNALSRMMAITDAQQQSAAGGEVGSTASSSGATSTRLDCTSEAVRDAFDAEVRAVAQLFKLPYDQRDQQAALMRVVRKRVEECMVAEAAATQQNSAAQPAQPHAAAGAAAQQPTVAAAASSSSAKRSTGPVRGRSRLPAAAPLPSTPAELAAALDGLESGFPSTGDELVERAARVLRLLFLHDLRASQNLANELMALAQNYTADPRTDTKLGQVGR